MNYDSDNPPPALIRCILASDILGQTGLARSRGRIRALFLSQCVSGFSFGYKAKMSKTLHL